VHLYAAGRWEAYVDPTPWILVIDDDRWTREALVSILRRAGYQVTTQERVGQELDAGQFPQRYQVAVLDYHLPDLNGLEVARRLKQFQPDCRIVMISSELPNLPELAGQEAVVDRFLAKPFSKDAILEVIAQLCPSPAK
jgi:two-component system nitrogen regulation response regulator GlnG